ncbi:MAG: beta-hydroxyacyl-ACP dehydratase [Phycisphaerales bacterium]|nr:beta-hydroxyacyl-ACP dehydratase [Phycisphaerales bacterium]
MTPTPHTAAPPGERASSRAVEHGPSGSPDGPGGGGAPRNTPLFDVSHVDLAARAVTREGLESYIPHRGVMMQLDGVVWHSEDFTQGVGIRHVRPDEFWCAGHIPGRPIMPGVLMIETGAQLASFLYFSRMDHRKFAGFVRIEDFSFRDTVVPGDDLILLSQEVKFSSRRFIADVQGMVRGKVVFGGRVTGMIF